MIESKASASVVRSQILLVEGENMSLPDLDVVGSLGKEYKVEPNRCSDQDRTPEPCTPNPIVVG